MTAPPSPPDSRNERRAGRNVCNDEDDWRLSRWFAITKGMVSAQDMRLIQLPQLFRLLSCTRSPGSQLNPPQEHAQFNVFGQPKCDVIFRVYIVTLRCSLKMHDINLLHHVFACVAARPPASW